MASALAPIVTRAGPGRAAVATTRRGHQVQRRLTCRRFTLARAPAPSKRLPRHLRLWIDLAMASRHARARSAILRRPTCSCCANRWIPTAWNSLTHDEGRVDSARSSAQCSIDKRSFLRYEGLRRCVSQRETVPPSACDMALAWLAQRPSTLATHV
jgi:hypothetical protein